MLKIVRTIKERCLQLVTIDKSEAVVNVLKNIQFIMISLFDG